MNNHKAQPNQYTPPTTVWDKPPTRWQRLTCNHYRAQPVYTAKDTPPGHYHAILAHYLCPECGRKLSITHRRHRVNPIVPLFLIALAILISYWFLT